MAATKRTRANLEFLLVKAELKGVPEKALLKSRNIGQVDLIWSLTNKPIGSLSPNPPRLDRLRIR